MEDGWVDRYTSYSLQYENWGFIDDTIIYKDYDFSGSDGYTCTQYELYQNEQYSEDSKIKKGDLIEKDTTYYAKKIE